MFKKKLIKKFKMKHTKCKTHSFAIVKKKKKETKFTMNFTWAKISNAKKKK